MCKKQVPVISSPYCLRCGKPLTEDIEEYCRDCHRREVAFEQGRSVWQHKAPVSTAIYQFKYKNHRQYGKIFAREMAALYQTDILRWQIDEIIPIPLHPSKRRKRGYNQAEILANELGKVLSVSVNTKSLMRIRNTKPQKGLDHQERARNLEGAFAASAVGKIGKHILLVDDIYTTGNTIHRAAKMLKMAGAEKVYFLTISIGQGL